MDLAYIIIYLQIFSIIFTACCAVWIEERIEKYAIKWLQEKYTLKEIIEKWTNEKNSSSGQPSNE